MSDVGKMVLIFVIAGMVLGGMLLIVSGLTSESTMVTTVPSVATENVNATTDVVDNISTMSVGILLPVLIIIAVLIVIIAITLFSRRK